MRGEVRAVRMARLEHVVVRACAAACRRRRAAPTAAAFPDCSSCRCRRAALSLNTKACMPGAVLSLRDRAAGERHRVEVPLERRFARARRSRRCPWPRPPPAASSTIQSPSVSWRLSLPSRSYRYRCWKPLRSELQRKSPLSRNCRSSCRLTKVLLVSVSSVRWRPLRRSASIRSRRRWSRLSTWKATRWPSAQSTRAR